MPELLPSITITLSSEYEHEILYTVQYAHTNTLSLPPPHSLLHSCRATEWPFWVGMIVPFILVTIFNWIMFILIMASICSHTKAPVTDKKEGSKINLLKTNFTIAATLAVVFGLGWALGLVATSLPVKELTFTFQVLFSIFVGAQGLLLFLLHGVRMGGG